MKYIALLTISPAQADIVGREYIKLSGVTSVAPLSMKISSPKAINWTLKQYGYS
jgi:hypothetical protein